MQSYNSIEDKSTKVFRPCTNCKGTMRLVGSRSQHGAFEYYSCTTCHDALDLRLLSDANGEVAA